MLVLNKLEGEERRRWVPLGVWPGVEVQIRLRGLKDQERFRRQMVREGTVRETKDGIEIREGRLMEFARAFAEAFVTDWQGPIRLEEGDTEAPPYSPGKMAEIFNAAPSTLRTVREALDEEADFFLESGADSKS